MHPDQLTVSLAAVRSLVDDQFPAWTHLPVSAVRAGGTVNAIFRIGDRLAARFPLRPGEATWERLRAEADAARELAGHTRFPTPEPVALGRPGPGCPYPWSVQTWLPGTTATDDGARLLLCLLPGAILQRAASGRDVAAAVRRAAATLLGG